MIAMETFWSINATQVLMLLVTIGGIITWFSRFEGRVSTNSEGLKTFSEQTEKTFTDHRGLLAGLFDRLERIDREGTRKSQQAIAADEKLYAVNTKRIDRLEEITQVIPAMAKDVEWIADSVKKNGKV